MSRVVMCALIALGNFKPELERWVGTSLFHALYTYGNIGYVDIPENVGGVIGLDTNTYHL